MVLSHKKDLKTGKIMSVKEMEYFLLQDPKISDLVVAGDTNAKSPDTKLTTQQIQHEVSVFSRVLINVNF